MINKIDGILDRVQTILLPVTSFFMLIHVIQGDLDFGLVTWGFLGTWNRLDLMKRNTHDHT